MTGLSQAGRRVHSAKGARHGGSGLRRAPRAGRGFSHALHAEWTKQRTVPGTGWLLAGVVALTVAVGALACLAVSCPDGQRCAVDLARTSLTGLDLGQAVVAVIAVLAIGGEYSTAMIRVTLAAMPRRSVVLAAKAIVVTGLVLIAAAAAVLGSVLIGRLILTGHGLTPAHGYPALSLTDGPVLRAAGGSALYLALIAMFSIGVAAVVRDQAPAIAVVLGVLYVFPIVAAALRADPHWQHRVERYAPMAGLAIQATTGLKSLPIGPWQGLAVLACWSAAAPLAGGVLLHIRDA